MGRKTHDEQEKLSSLKDELGIHKLRVKRKYLEIDVLELL
jgi:hypothetical protein